MTVNHLIFAFTLNSKLILAYHFIQFSLKTKPPIVKKFYIRHGVSGNFLFPAFV